MSYNLGFRFEPDYLHVEAIGTRSPETTLAIAQDSVKACLEHGYKIVLIDVLSMTGAVISTVEAYDVGQKVQEKLGFHPELKAAIVVPEERRELYHFFETVLVNRGFNVRMFYEVADAG
jgi:hypothetical protein